MLGYVNTNDQRAERDHAVRPLGRQQPAGRGLARRRPRQMPSTVVVTSKAMGHLGGNSLTAQIVPPTAQQPGARPSRSTGNAIRVFPATNASGAVTSTANDVIAAINADPDASQARPRDQVPHVRDRRHRRRPAEHRVAAQRPAARAGDGRARPADPVRAAHRQGARRRSKVGVYLYCQEHAGEIATSGVCLETAERLVRNYGTDPQTTALVDGLEIFIVPQINSDGVNHSIYDSPRRTNMAPYCYDPASTENLGDPANRNNYGVNINRNFSVGSVFDGFQGASTGCSGGNTAGLFELSEPETANEVWVQNTFRNIKFSNNIHSSGGYFMWPPGAYTPRACRCRTRRTAR